MIYPWHRQLFLSGYLLLSMKGIVKMNILVYAPPIYSVGFGVKPALTASAPTRIVNTTQPTDTFAHSASLQRSGVVFCGLPDMKVEKVLLSKTIFFVLDVLLMKMSSVPDKKAAPFTNLLTENSD